MTSRSPTRAEKDAHAARVRQDREAAAALGRCRSCNTIPEINPRTGLRFRSCQHHRDIDWNRKKTPNGKR